LSDGRLLEYPTDDDGSAQAMRDLYGERFLYCPAIGWMEYDGTCWKAGADAAVSLAAVDTLTRRRCAVTKYQRATGNTREHEDILRFSRATKQRIDGCLYVFRSYVTEPDVEVFDRDPDQLNVLNGVVNLRTKSLSQHCPRQRFTYVVPVAWDPEADSSAWHNFIHAAVGNHEETCHFLQRAIGYAFTGHTREEVLFYLYGPPRAGKGTLAETIQALLPHPISAAVDFNTFTAKRDGDTQNFDLAPLRPSRIVFASESNRYQALNPAKIKQLTGGDYVYCAFKHRDHFRYRPQYTVVLLSNHEVNGDPEDDALWGRVLVVTFPTSHLGTEDKGLKEHLRQSEHLQGLLRWVVEGAASWYEGGLQPPAAIVAVTKEQREAQDYGRQWISDYCELRAEAWAASKALMESYQAWCEENNVKAGTAKDLAASLKRLGCKPDKQQHQRGFRGITLRMPPESGHQGQGTAGTAETRVGATELDLKGQPQIQVSLLSPVPADELMPREAPLALSASNGHDPAANAALPRELSEVIDRLHEAQRKADSARARRASAAERWGPESLQAKTAAAQWGTLEANVDELQAEMHRIARLDPVL
jgi:putative DNA primase/helicase